jgi:hypothetical protein
MDKPRGFSAQPTDALAYRDCGLGAEGCAPAFVHCNLDSELGVALLCQRLAHLNFGTFVLLPGGTTYARTPKHDSIVSVQMN